MLGDPGYPDLTMVRDDRLIFAELKVPPNKSTGAQIAWQAMLEEARVEVYVWTPADLPKIIETLRQ